ncbi:MAG: peptide-methionine (S)-S-oxide reductase [Deltaproteobacteria bacterium]|nr:peptide-methionine (S)-S-oxide reductase [Deltaproteobacteria bacterium]MBW2176992.1 peptide-methionine (S)-S-oxide reductase [Deltaproteobacteria bacterium]MBW2612224.1 peptide-methionine (S)-S-oxide reductase [Deltaproteobacteria bacterium]
MIRTRVGYAGGKMEAPTYRRIGDHTETVELDYDPARITYARLLEIIWESHTPDSRNVSGQYMHAIFYHDDEQRQMAAASKITHAEKTGRSVTTEVLPLRSFTMAEDYHQKYILKQHADLMQEMLRIYPQHRDLVASTAAARLNGYAGGNGSHDQLSRELSNLGLSTAGKQILTGLIRR